MTCGKQKTDFQLRHMRDVLFGHGDLDLRIVGHREAEILPHGFCECLFPQLDDCQINSFATCGRKLAFPVVAGSEIAQFQIGLVGDMVQILLKWEVYLSGGTSFSLIGSIQHSLQKVAIFLCPQGIKRAPDLAR